jgi:hypothetical protein
MAGAIEFRKFCYTSSDFGLAEGVSSFVGVRRNEFTSNLLQTHMEVGVATWQGGLPPFSPRNLEFSFGI